MTDRTYIVGKSEKNGLFAVSPADYPSAELAGALLNALSWTLRQHDNHAQVVALPSGKVLWDSRQKGALGKVPMPIWQAACDLVF